MVANNQLSQNISLEVIEQMSFYNIEDFCDTKKHTFTYFELCLFFKLFYKRVHYEIPTYTKEYENDVYEDGTVKDDSVWTKMHQTYKALSYWVWSDEVMPDYEPAEFVVSGVKVWNDRHLPKRYDYYNQTFIGQKFQERFAEIIGTERLGIEERLRVHEELLTFLRNGMELEEGVKKALQTIRKEDFMKT